MRQDTFLFNWKSSCGRMLTSVSIIAFLVISTVQPVFAKATLYIPNQFSNTVSVIDGASYSTIKTIAVEQEPYGVAISPDGKSVFITSTAVDTVSVIDTETNAVTHTVIVGDKPLGVAVSPDGRYAYVANVGDDTLSVIDTSSYSVIKTITAGDDPHGLAFLPDGSRLYVTNYYGGNVSVYDTASNKLIKTIPVGTAPHGIAVHPEGFYVYTANVWSNTVSVISTATNSVVKTISMGAYPFFPVIDKSGKTLYVSNWGAETVTVINIPSHEVVGTIAVEATPHGVAVDEANARLYVANEGDNCVSVIDLDSQTVITNVTVGKAPIAFGNFAFDDSFFTGQKNYQYSATYFPFTSSDPAVAKPLGIGPVADGLNTLKLMLEFDQFPSSVDVYLALYASAMGPDIWLITPGSGLQPISKGIVPWKSATTGPIDEALFGEIPMSNLPVGTYNFYVMVSPPGSRDSYHLWTTSFLGQYQIIDVAERIVNNLGGELGAEATLLAMDNGYSLRQLADAAMSGRLLANGNISTVSGGVEVPSTPPFEIIIRSTAQAHNAPISIANKFMIRNLLGHVLVLLKEAGLELPADDAGQNVLIVGVLIGIQNSGYDLPEGAKAIMDGRVKVKIDRKTLTAALTDANGNEIPPENPTGGQGVFSDPPGMCGPDDDKDDDQYWSAAHCPQSTRFGVDCDDGNSNINPGMIEICDDNVDNNCDGKVDAQDPVCNKCPDPSYPTPCGPYCYPSGDVCCDESGNACEAGSFCHPLGGCCSNSQVVCGTGCMPVDSVCCGNGPTYCPAGYECVVGGGCRSVNANTSHQLHLDAEWQPAFERPSNDYFVIEDTVD